MKQNKTGTTIFQVRIQLSDTQAKAMIDRVMTIFDWATLSNAPKDLVREKLRMQFAELNFAGETE